MMAAQGALDLFSPAVAGWFRQTFGAPTPPQEQGWPAIARGENALVLAPTGSGKTLTAFLWSLDLLFRDLQAEPEPERRPRGKAAPSDYRPGVRVLYVSPLKALNNDVERNLQRPLEGIRAAARQRGETLPALRVGVRTGDTPPADRQRMVRQPPQILITTPESLYLMLTAERAQGMFATTHTVIVDEIHTLVGTKRGAHLALSLERLERVADPESGSGPGRRRRRQRIGLSATVRPLEEAARFLGGQERTAAGETVPRPVTVIEAAYQKSLDVRVVSALDDFRTAPGSSVWTSVIPEVTQLIETHRTTLVFCNSRRLAERTSDRLNERRLMERLGTPGALEAVAPPRRGTAVGADTGMFATGVDRSLLEAAGLQPIRAHHGSMSKASRLEMEEALKAGTLPALVATSSLELGIDIGEVDLVVHLQSPKSVASGLQRVGRSGHLVGQTSVGRIFPTHAEDVMEAAAVARGMLRGEIEATHTPENPLDILAQHLMAAVAGQDWDYDELYHLVRGAYPYRNLSPAAFRGVVEMLAGKYPAHISRYLQPRLSWDRVNDRLAALPGTRLLAIGSGGTIPDRGAYSMVLTDRRTKVGELDEEFVFESRPGDTFILGSQVWRVTDITDDRVVAEPAPGEIPRMPFWRGDAPWRPYDLGKRIGAFRRRVVDLLAALGPADITRLLALTEDEMAALIGASAGRDGGSDADRDATAQGDVLLPLLTFLCRECALDRNSAVLVVTYVAGQVGAAGEIATDRRIVVETFEDALGDPRMVIHSPFGGRVNGPWGIALAHSLRQRLGVEPQVITGDDGILLRFGNAAEQTEAPEAPGGPQGGPQGTPQGGPQGGSQRGSPGVEHGTRSGDASPDAVPDAVPDASPADLLGVVTGLTSAEAKERLLAELPGSAVFGAQFRMNAARALLLPRERAGKRTPLWLSRLRAKDLLQAVGRFDDFPIVLETYRDCLRDIMDLDGLTEILDRIQRGEIRVVVRESELPSPVAMGLDYRMAMQYVYEYDAPRGEKQLAALSLNRTLLADLLRDGTLADLLKPDAVAEVTARVERTATEGRARTVEELAQLLYEMGDLSDDDIRARCQPETAGGEPREWTRVLAAAGRLVPRVTGGEWRWVHAERLPEYDNLTHNPLPVLRRRLMHSGPATAGALARRYDLDVATVEASLRSLGEDVVAGHFTPLPAPDRDTPDDAEQWIDRRVLEQMHRRTLSLLRREVQPVPLAAYADFLRRWQGVAPGQHDAHGVGGDTGRAGRSDDPAALNRVLQQLRGMAVPGVAWERDVLPQRLVDFDPASLAERCQSGDVMWVAEGGRDAHRARVRFFFRGEGGIFLERRPDAAVVEGLSPAATAVYELLGAEGAALLADVVDGAGLSRPAAQAALVELVLAGLVTNDTLAALRAVLGYDPPPAARAVARSSLEAQLAARMGHQPRRMTPGRLRDTRRRAREVAFAAHPAGVALGGRGIVSGWTGRWSLVRRSSLLGKPLAEGDRALRQARQLLTRWGVVTRTALEREAPTVRWEAVSPALAQLELRGEVRRGYFVAGLPGLQYALPEVVERLRAVNAERFAFSEDDGAGGAAVAGATDGYAAAPVVLGGADPAQLYGTETFGGRLRFQRTASTAVAMVRGEPVAAFEDGGAGAVVAAEHPAIVPALRALARWWAGRRRGTERVRVERWDGAPVLTGDGVPLLEAAGFVRERGAMVWLEAPDARPVL